ncbi:MAG: DUF3298 domain-containing protein [Oscillospiraceae bacterium]|nr:DUF3298 domain-containing protein [Oscillospiraceae bacterium]
MFTPKYILATTLLITFTLTSCTQLPISSSPQSTTPTSETPATTTSETASLHEITTITSISSEDQLSSTLYPQVILTQTPESLDSENSSGLLYFKGSIYKPQILIPSSPDVQNAIQSKLDEQYESNYVESESLRMESLENFGQVPVELEISQFSSSCEKMFTANNAFSLMNKNYAFYMGGVHGTESGVTCTFDITTGELLTLGDICTGENVLPSLSELFIKNIPEELEDGFLTDPEAAIKDLVNAGTDTKHFYFAPDGLHLVFSPYEIACYAAGFVDICVQYTDLSEIVKPEYFPKNISTDESSCSISYVKDIDISKYSNSYGEISSPVCITAADTVSNVTAKTVSADKNKHEGLMVYYADYLCYNDIMYLSGLSDPEDYYELSYSVGTRTFDDKVSLGDQ